MSHHHKRRWPGLIWQFLLAMFLSTLIIVGLVAMAVLVTLLFNWIFSKLQP